MDTEVVPPSESKTDSNETGGEGLVVSADHEEQEPSLDSDNKESRIAARRKRIKMKIEADKRAAQGKDITVDEVVDPEKTRISSKQIKKSEVRVEKLITDGTTLVTNVKVAGDSREVTKRQDEDEGKKARMERLEAEVTAGAERFDEIMRKWSESKGKTIPQELLGLLQQQKTGCSAMVDEKDKLIGELQHELKTKDDQYVKDLKKQAEDVDLILERMEEQAKTLLRANKEEMGEIEKSYEKERRKLIESQRAEWDRITKDRSEKEKSYLEEVQKRIDRNEDEVHHLRVRNAEEFNQIKIKLETDIQSLQQQIQQMKATFQLNAEKLEYNFQVLKKRDEENTVTISQQKRRLTRLQDTLNNLRGKLSKQEKACKHEMQLLMDEYRKNTEQYRELLKKVKHFQMIDTKRFQDVWLMNEEKVREIAEEVQNSDEIIHRQQLGLDWKAPPLVESPMAKLIAEKPSDRQKDVNKATLYASQIISDTGTDTPSTPEVQSTEDGTPSPQNKRYSIVLIKKVLELLCSECEFLIESKLLRLLTPLEQDEQIMMKLDSIFKAIGVETEDHIHLLVSYFTSKSTNPDALQEVEMGDSPLDVTAPSLVHPNEVLGRLCSFVNDKQGAAGTDTPSLSKGLVGTRGSFERLLEGNFWPKMAEDTLPVTHEKVWDALLSGLEKYHTILQARSTLIDDTDSLRQQNTELRLLLHQYMHARINQELEIPPSLALPVQDTI